MRYPKTRARLPRRFYTPDEYCDVTGESRASAYNGMKAGRIPYIEDGGRRRIPVDFVDQQVAKAMAMVPESAPEPARKSKANPQQAAAE